MPCQWTTVRADNSPLENEMNKVTITAMDALKGSKDEFDMNTIYCICKDRDNGASTLDWTGRDEFEGKGNIPKLEAQKPSTLRQFLAEKVKDGKCKRGATTVGHLKLLYQCDCVDVQIRQWQSTESTTKVHSKLDEGTENVLSTSCQACRTSKRMKDVQYDTSA